MLFLLLLSKLWLVYSAFSFQTHIIFKAVNVWAVMPWSLVDKCQCFGRICCLHLQVITVSPQDHNLINHHDKVKCFVPVLTAPDAWLPVLPQLWLPLRLLPCPSVGNMLCLLHLDGVAAKIWTVNYITAIPTAVCTCVLTWQYCIQKENNVSYTYIFISSILAVCCC
jgi:hypothetical protein